MNLRLFLKPHEKQFGGLAKIMQRASSSSVFASRFVDCILQEFWEDHTWRRKCLPFMLAVTCNIIYLGNTAALSLLAEERERNFWFRISLGYITIANNYYLAYQEYKQLRLTTWTEYSSSIWNCIDLSFILMNPLFIAVSMPNEPYIHF